MPQGTTEVSLKRPNGTWAGLEDSSSQAMTIPGVSFSVLRGCYHNRDGTELRRWLGSTVVGQPLLGKEMVIHEVATGGGTTTISCGVRLYSADSQNAYAPPKDNHFQPTGTFEVYIVGSDVITTGFYTATWVSGTAFSFSHTASGTETAGTGTGAAIIQNVSEPHILTQSDGKPVIIGETNSYDESGGGTAKKSCGAWVGSKVLDPANVEVPGWVDYITANTNNTHEIGNDAGFISWPNPTMQHNRGGSAASANSYLYSMNIVRRMNADVLNRRVLVAVPGHGCCFEVNVDRARLPFQMSHAHMEGRWAGGTTGLLSLYNPWINHRYMTCLGIPRGVHVSMTDEDDAPTTPGIISGDESPLQTPLNALDQMYVAVGYMDMQTGEVGLPSRSILYQKRSGVVQGTADHMFALTPRGVMGEAGNLAVIWYMSEPAGAGIRVLFPWLVVAPGMFPSWIDGGNNSQPSVGSAQRRDFDWYLPIDPEAMAAAGGGSAIQISSGAKQPPDSAQAKRPNRFPVIEQMPTGAGWIKAIRGRAFIGNDRPEYTKLTCVRWSDQDGGPRAEISTGEKSDSVKNHILFPTGEVQDTVGFTYQDLLCDSYVVPPSYEGHDVYFLEILDIGNESGEPSQATGPDGLDYAVSTQLQLRENEPGRFLSQSAISSEGNGSFCDFSVDRTVGQFSGTDETTAYLRRRPDLVFFSEEGFPGVMPKTNVLPVDTLAGQTVTGAVRIGDDALVFTDRSTHLFVWSLLPRQATSRTVTNEYGLIAPASTVEGPGFAAWISHEGPAVFQQGGGFRWLGGNILDLWRTFVTQADGRMEHIQGIHDRDRGLVIWQVTTAFSDTTSDTTKSKSTCDRLLVWNYRVDAFSLVHLGDAQEVHCIGSLPINDTAVGNYYWSPCFVSNSTNSARYEVQSWDERYLDRATTPNEFTASADKTAGSAVFASTTAVATTNAGDEGAIYGPGNRLRWWGTIASSTGNNITVTDDDGADWKMNDKFLARITTMQMSTNFMRAGDLNKRVNIRGVNLRLETFQNSAASYTARSWARVRVEDQDGKVINFGNNVWGDEISDGVNRFKSGAHDAQHFKVHVDIISNVQVRLKDISVEVEATV